MKLLGIAGVVFLGATIANMTVVAQKVSIGIAPVFDGGGEDFGRVAEMFQQQPGAHRPDVLDEIKRDERFP